MRRRYARPITNKRSVQWGSASLAPLNLTTGSTTVLPISPGGLGTLSAMGVPTLMRIVGRLRILNTGASGTESFGAAGIIVCTNPAVVPVPFGTDASKDWTWHQYFWLPNTSGTSVEARFIDYAIDSKVMRRIDDTEDIFFIINNQPASTATLRYFFSARILVKRP